MSRTKYVICIDNAEYPASLEKRKIYEVVSAPSDTGAGMIRIIDESGSDYLYPESCFIEAPLPKDVEAAIARVA